MTAPTKNPDACWLCGARESSHVMVALGDDLCHARVCGSHPIRDVVLNVGRQGWRISVDLSLYEDVAHVAARKAKR